MRSLFFSLFLLTRDICNFIIYCMPSYSGSENCNYEFAPAVPVALDAENNLMEIH